MRDLKKILIKPESTIRHAMRVIDSGALKIALVVDDDTRLVGTVTDGDIRRGILREVVLDASVKQIMNINPAVATTDQGREEILALMKGRELYQIPILSNDGRLVGLETLSDLSLTANQDGWVVLMAGGLGSRMKPMTDNCPKPMLKVGGRPILETIIDNLIAYGFRRFYIAVNYMAEVIQEYFGDGSRWGVDIRYLHEEKRLGTAGALSLLPEKPTSRLVVMNSDLLTKINFQQLLDFHGEHRSMGTMCVREYDFQVPYGVVGVDAHRLVSIEEKPVQRFFVNAGIYVLDAEVLDLIEPNIYCDMPAVFEKMISQQAETTVFPIREYWLDLGRMEDFMRAQGEFGRVFE